MTQIMFHFPWLSCLYWVFMSHKNCYLLVGLFLQSGKNMGEPHHVKPDPLITERKVDMWGTLLSSVHARINDPNPLFLFRHVLARYKSIIRQNIDLSSSWKSELFPFYVLTFKTAYNSPCILDSSHKSFLVRLSLPSSQVPSELDTIGSCENQVCVGCEIRNFHHDDIIQSQEVPCHWYTPVFCRHMSHFLWEYRASFEPHLAIKV